MVTIDMHVGQHVHEFPTLQSSHLSDEASQQSIASYVERHPQPHITAALIHNAVELARICHLELAQQMALHRDLLTGGKAISLSCEGFQADMISLRLEGLLLISFMSQDSWSIPLPL
jgi:hypothetical protein